MIEIDILFLGYLLVFVLLVSIGGFLKECERLSFYQIFLLFNVPLVATSEFYLFSLTVAFFSLSTWLLTDFPASFYALGGRGGFNSSLLPV